MEVISLTQNTPTAGYVAQCSFHEKAMLASSLMEVRWTGVEEFTWAKVRRFSAAEKNVLRSHLLATESLSGTSRSIKCRSGCATADSQ